MQEPPASLDYRCVELGSWTITGRGKDRKVTLFPFKTLNQIEQDSSATDRSPEQIQRGERRDKMRLMLETGVVKNRAELAEYFGLSRARITQILGPAKPKT
jgi:hypothetical protein